MIDRNRGAVGLGLSPVGTCQGFDPIAGYFKP
jgi:hypothetical protein